MGEDPDEILEWPIGKVHLMLEGYKRKGEREKAAMKAAQREAERESKFRR